jgi:hypothetical protein
LLIPTHYSLYLIDPTRQRRHLQFPNGLGDLDVTRAGIGAVIDGVTARQAVRLGDDLHPLGSAFVAAVVDETVGSHERGRTVVFLAGPERRAGGRAGGAQDALGRVVEAGALLGGLEALASICGER